MISADQPAIPDKKHLDNRILIPEIFTVIHGYCNDVSVFLPVAGEVVEQNPALEENPELVNKDPYGEGWLIKMKPANAADLDNLLDAEGYKAVVNA